MRQEPPSNGSELLHLHRTLNIAATNTAIFICFGQDDIRPSDNLIESARNNFVEIAKWCHTVKAVLAELGETYDIH